MWLGGVAGVVLACGVAEVGAQGTEEGSAGGGESATGPEAAVVNGAAGVELFPGSGMLWEAAADELAGTLGWPEESRTSTTSSFRRYAVGEVFGRKAFSMVLHAQEGKPVSVGFVFANKGDIGAMMEVKPDAKEHEKRRAEQQVLRDYKRFILEDERALRQKLTELFGASKAQRMGVAQTAETVQRWDWRGHTFLLSAPRGEYVSLRIVPTEGMSDTGIERVAQADMRQRLRERVQRSENGDVLLTDIPMVDQGPKGYCVPATFERALRYMGIPADLYVLAMAGNTEVGGGTTLQAIQDGVRLLVQRYGRRMETQGGRLTPALVSRYIDQGVPLLWGMHSTLAYNDLANERTAQRRKVTDWERWKKEVLMPARRQARNLGKVKERRHICMIIGYNRDTGEVAVSDSWGPAAALRWVLFEEADAVSFGDFIAILP